MAIWSSVLSNDKRRQDLVAPWLVKAKVSPPRRNNTAFFRKGLQEQLAHAREQPVTLIEAPAGFGKSTLLAQWVEKLSQQNILTAWLSIEEADDPDSLISYLAFAFHVAGLDMSEHGLLSPQFKGDQRITFALNEFIAAVERSEKPTVLVLDDFERASNQVIEQVISRLLSNLPENLHLVIACRQNPGLSLSRLEISGLLHRINANDLRLGVEEVRQIFGVGLSDVEADLIISRTAGWPVVIQLLKSVCGDNPRDRQNRINGFTGASDQAAAYFTEQLFNSLTVEQRDFLSETSVIERISPEAGNYLRERSDSISLMASLASLDSLFPEIEPGGQIRRLHPLLREHLELALEKTKPERYAYLHRRTAHWAFEHGQTNRAIAHAKKAHDEELAGDFVEKTKGLQIWINEGMDRLEDMLNLLSPDILNTFPRLILARAIIEMKKGHIRKARKFLDQASMASKGFTEDRPGGDGKMLLTDRYLTESLLLGYSCLPFHRHLSGIAIKTVIENAGDDYTIKGFIITIDCLSMQQVGRFEESRAQGAKAIEAYRMAKSIYGEVFIYIHTGMIALAEGQMAAVKSLYGKASRLSREHFPGDRGLKSILDACLAEYHWEICEPRSASRLIGKVPLAFENREAWFDVYMSAFRTSAFVMVSEGDEAGIETFFEKALTHTRTEELERLENFLKALQIFVYFDLGRKKEALTFYEDWYPTGRLMSNVWREQEILCVARARALANKGELDTAVEILRELVTIAIDQGNQRNMAYGLYWIVSLADKDGQKEELLSALIDLAGIACALSGTHVLRLLQPRLERLEEIATGYQGTSLKQIETLLDMVRNLAINKDDAAPLFSPREQEVLGELSKGLSDKEIARALDVTPNTVKFHLKNIYSKTGARNRIEALNYASSLIQ